MRVMSKGCACDDGDEVKDFDSTFYKQCFMDKELIVQCASYLRVLVEDLIKRFVKRKVL